jgi:hypothetical protein
MKHVVDTPGRWQGQLICHRGNFFDDPEGSITFCGEFRRLIREFQIFPF